MRYLTILATFILCASTAWGGFGYGRVVVGGVVSAPLGISDNFSGDTSSKYTSIGGTLSITSGYATTTAWSAYTGYYSDSSVGASNMSVEADCLIGNANDYVGIVVRRNTSNNTHYEVRMYGDYIRLYSVSGTTPSLIAGYNATYSTNTVYNVRVDISGSSIKVYVDDVERINQSDSTYSTGTYGGFTVSRGNGGLNYIDNFAASAL